MFHRSQHKIYARLCHPIPFSILSDTPRCHMKFAESIEMTAKTEAEKQQNHCKHNER